MEYKLDVKKFKRSLIQSGYETRFAFAAKNGIHRNTLNDFLRGRSVFLRSFKKMAEGLQIDPLDLLIPESDLKVDLPHIDEIKPIVARLAKKNKKMAVVLLGSQAKKKAKKYSDWDLGIFSFPRPIDGIQYLRLKRQVEEWSEDLVRKVDLVNLNQAPLWFLEDLENFVIFLDGHAESFAYLKGILDGIQRKNETA
ncbi:MAG: nucleotidyltransferase domain-containing protein [Deltaproteobacteria bacterium]|nr:nucleotidyltransferase domain-containing protein [Deltaproteobacteria bacterium]